MQPAGEPTPDDPRSLAATRAFFATRAALWEEQFADDMPAYRRAVAGLAPPTGATALDVGCGTGRALPWLRAAVGPTGRVAAEERYLALAVRQRSGPC